MARGFEKSVVLQHDGPGVRQASNSTKILNFLVVLQDCRLKPHELYCSIAHIQARPFAPLHTFDVTFKPASFHLTDKSAVRYMKTLLMILTIGPSCAMEVETCLMKICTTRLCAWLGLGPKGRNEGVVQPLSFCQTLLPNSMMSANDSGVCLSKEHWA